MLDTNNFFKENDKKLKPLIALPTKNIHTDYILKQCSFLIRFLESHFSKASFRTLPNYRKIMILSKHPGTVWAHLKRQNKTFKFSGANKGESRDFLRHIWQDKGSNFTSHTNKRENTLALYQ